MSITAKRSKYNKTDSESETKINPKNIQLLEKYKQDMDMRSLSPASIYQYERDIKQWMSYLVEHQFNPEVTEVKEDDIEEFIYWAKQNGNNVERIKRRIASISAFYIYLRRKKICIENPCEFIIRPKKGLPVVVQTFLSLEQFEQLKQSLKDNGDLQLEVYARLSLDTMARVNAVSNLTWEQIDFENRTIDDVLEKEGYIVTLYFGEEVKQLLLQLKEQREREGINSPYIFLTSKNEHASVASLTEWANKIGKLIGIDTFHPHDFRHSGSQLMNIKGAPIELISELLNHKDLTTTQKHYLRQDKSMIKQKKDLFAL